MNKFCVKNANMGLMKAFVFSLMFACFVCAKAQVDSTNTRPRLSEQFGAYEELSLMAGYSINRRSEKGRRDNHILEFGLYKSKNFYYAESVGHAHYFSNEFMFNSDSFYIGPKIGGFFHIWMFYLGSELVYYTDFKGQALHIVPTFGLGGPKGRLGFGLHVPLSNNLFEHTNVLSIGFTYQIRNLRKRKIENF